MLSLLVLYLPKIPKKILFAEYMLRSTGYISVDTFQLIGVAFKKEIITQIYF